MNWIEIDCSQDPPVEVERPATAEEIAAQKAFVKAVEEREKNPPLTLEQRIAALEARSV